VAAAVALALPTLAPAPAHRVRVLVAAHDLAAGRRLTSADLRVAGWAPGTAPRDGLGEPGQAAGRTLAGPLTEGSPVTRADLLGPGLLTGQEVGLLAVPVRLSGVAPSGLVQAGDRVDVLSAASGSAVATDAVVLAADLGPAADGGAGALDGFGGQSGGATGGSGTAGAVLVLGVGLDAAERLTRAQAAGPLGVAVHAR
jgi:pilus assembly protein CpaB